MNASPATPAAGTDVSRKDLANAIRALSMDAVQKAKSGHPGMPMGMADVATVLFDRFLKFDPQRPDWPDRDRFVLSAGHGSMLLYSLLHLTGYPDMTLEELKNFRQLGSRTAGHPEYGHAKGIETTTGPLGQGLGNAVGMALAERIMAARFGKDLVDHFTYAIAGDGCLMEGISHEVGSLAGHLNLGKLIVLFDDNGISIDGATSLSCSDDQLRRFESYGWQTFQVDGHDPEAVAAAIAAAQVDTTKPALIACRTVIGFGSPNKQGTAATHGAPLGDDEIAATREALGWPHAPFEIPDAVLEAWRAIGRRGAATADAWEARLQAAPAELRQEFQRRMAGDLPEGFDQAILDFKRKVQSEQPKVATRQASGNVIETLAGILPELVGGSADLTGSNNTKAKAQQPITADDYSGQYVYYGIREHGMAAAMNGLALHGGVVPYGGTFLVFSDYCRPSIRLSALMGKRVVYVMTHDSIGLGEDGPTHQPVEHLAALRAMPNLNVFRPADAIETAECWQVALQTQERPSILALTRQGLPTVRQEAGEDNWSALGAYILSPAAGARQATLFASGSEVHLALQAQAQLREEGISAAVVSMPSWELFLEQPPHYRDEVMGPGALPVAIEAAGPFGWPRWLGPDGVYIGMQGFGASGPAEQLYEHFGITVDAIVKAVRNGL
ncbi:transketolase [Aquibaculum arenosum]|uniref:Transketolase n=1 Tax=Aquibaculum arenosum TaxID=3032591 RepID=A0ABT5YIF0_9PROT|nr:transketolase [Fodinicurvata sp. CAU 1616]MDF2094708.1 transketolase [Fodinicurvata sp. CAU 1616]